MRNEIEKSNFWNRLPSTFSNFWNFPTFKTEFDKILSGKCDFEEENDNYVINLEVPGVKKDEISINLKNDLLTIGWSRTSEKKNTGGKNFYERNEGSFSRSFHVEGSDVNRIEAELKNGVLKILVPKLENCKPKNIQIN